MTYTHSDMVFGEYEKSDVFEIEKSSITTVKNAKTVELVLLHSKRNALLFIEAKTTFPNNKNPESFNQQILEIIQKFLDSLYFTASIALNRNLDTKTCVNFPHFFDKPIQIKFVLVIKNHQKEWLPPVKLKIEQTIKKEIKIWNIEVFAINEDIAKERQLIIQ